MDIMAESSIIKIAVLGAESTGKTALCEALANHYRTVWVPEYAREYFNDSDIYNYTLDDLVNIAREQILRESKLLRDANQIIFSDTTLITLKIWAELEFETTPEFIREALKRERYDHYLLTDNSVNWQADPLRQNKHSRDLLFEMNEFELKNLGAAYTVISGLDEQRTKQAVGVIDEKFTGIRNL